MCAWPTAVGLGLDAVLGDPRTAHPVAAFGSVAAGAERLAYRDSRVAGTAYAVVLTGAAVGLGRLMGRRRWAVAVATWAVVGGTTLRREARALHDLLDSGDVAGARQRLPHLCGRDPSSLDSAELARATVESVAENTSDAVVAPQNSGATTAMVGHRSDRYLRFGWAAAR